MKRRFTKIGKRAFIEWNVCDTNTQLFVHVIAIQLQTFRHKCSCSCIARVCRHLPQPRPYTASFDRVRQSKNVLQTHHRSCRLCSYSFVPDCPTTLSEGLAVSFCALTDRPGVKIVRHAESLCRRDFFSQTIAFWICWRRSTSTPRIPQTFHNIERWKWWTIKTRPSYLKLNSYIDATTQNRRVLSDWIKRKAVDDISTRPAKLLCYELRTTQRSFFNDQRHRWSSSKQQRSPT